MGMILTQAGQNAINALLASNGTLTIAEMSFGSDDRHPTGGETELTTELIRKPVLNKTVDAEKTRFDARLEHDEGPFVIHEIGLHDEAGTLIFIGRVEGLTKLVTAGEAHSIDVSANVFTSNFQNVVVEVDSNFAFVPATRKIDAGTGLTGGGDFSADRELAVEFASKIEAIAATSSTKTMSPKRVKEAMEGIAGMGGKALPVDDLNAINKTCLFEFDSTATGAPNTNYDGRGWHIQGDGEASQIVVLAPTIIMFRDWDVDAEGWKGWRSILTDVSAKTSAYSIADAPDSWLIGDNFNGDTVIGLGAVSGQCHRIGNFAHISLALDFSSFSIPANGDGIISSSIDINALASFPEWFASLDSSGIGVAYGRFTGAGWDAPWMPFYCSANKSAGTLYFSTGDAGSMPAQASNATGLELKMSITVLVKD